MEKQTYDRSQTDKTGMAYIERREALKALSQSLKPLKTVMDTHLNDLLLGHYAHEQRKHPDDFKTFMAWQLVGYRIKKGEKGFPIWARPKILKMSEDYQRTNNFNHKTRPKEVLGQDEYSYYSMTYLFHIGQVEKLETESKTKKGGQNE